MASTLDPFIRVVMNMMRQFGGDSTLVVQEGPGEYDPSTGMSATVKTEYPVRMITMEFIQMSSGTRNKNGTAIEESDKQVFMQPAEGLPVPRPEIDTVLYKGVPHSIVTFKELNPTGGKAVLYELYIRR